LVLNDRYCINIKQQDPAKGAKTNKNVISKDYYAYQLMIRRDQDNVILRYRELYHQFMVDMYVKTESERFRYLRYNQKKLRAEVLKTIVRYRRWESYYRWNGMHKITDRYLHNHWFTRWSHWPDISQCTQTIHKSRVAGRKSNFSSKNVNVNELNPIFIQIQHLLPGDLMSFQSIGTVCDTTEAVNYPTYSF
jgi:hypothetical protein